MKTLSVDFIAKEEGDQREPGEVYHFWSGTTHYRYTSGDVAIVYAGETYAPAPIQRKKVSWSDKLEVNTLDITVSRATNPVLEFIQVAPQELIWVSVHKIHRDLLIEESIPIFLGQIKDFSFKGPAVQVKCVAFEKYLNQVVPRYRYGPGCQHTLYSDRCGVDINSFNLTLEVESISDDYLIIYSEEFAGYDEGWFNLGFLVFGNYQRMITDHAENYIKIKYPLIYLSSGDTITVAPGCDKTRDTCEQKFSNKIQQLGFPNIPIDNPATWS